jgi:hypothetical protein
MNKQGNESKNELEETRQNSQSMIEEQIFMMKGSIMMDTATG